MAVRCNVGGVDRLVRFALGIGLVRSYSLRRLV